MINSITVIYDNLAEEGFIGDWGFSAFLDGENPILFDTGAKPDIFIKNCKNAEIPLEETESIFISHNHWDHTGCIEKVISISKTPDIFIPESDAEEMEEKVKDKAVVVPILTPTVIAPEIFSTGILETGIDNPSFEHAFIGKTPKGYILITGCSHPGIVKITQRALEITEEKLFLILGGFHLYKTENENVKKIAEELKRMTEYIAPCHCTGEKAVKVFKETFKDRFIYCKAGTEITF
ncbi:MBL fold metallo-hydrolase [Desulfurobacterium atlanticum]|uniref:7,8-dihydropterin-6-yl-methyl-4-(Beta-D-ribofuranosyl)aminobenzene 5'-phosphate synthase n=1 Tax=Desulfurobacterium atlanticum TaxID=240169 RepID=A0A239A9S3_9BACT|nr:MBL fold metallo-hydrolase [Desulfurobacterium atlanticum]SNR91828.1 7,8-dihydropterin-6-yl-methyl-4-(beta-D-ribofuranosyl)aminobenzene 5'-phosphate synthase [Desulfurobacterium atlanticum]